MRFGAACMGAQAGPRQVRVFCAKPAAEPAAKERGTEGGPQAAPPPQEHAAPAHLLDEHAPHELCHRPVADVHPPLARQRDGQPPRQRRDRQRLLLRSPHDARHGRAGGCLPRVRARARRRPEHRACPATRAAPGMPAATRRSATHHSHGHLASRTPPAPPALVECALIGGARLHALHLHPPSRPAALCTPTHLQHRQLGGLGQGKGDGEAQQVRVGQVRRQRDHVVLLGGRRGCVCGCGQAAARMCWKASWRRQALLDVLRLMGGRAGVHGVEGKLAGRARGLRAACRPRGCKAGSGTWRRPHPAAACCLQSSNGARNCGASRAWMEGLE